MNISIIANSVFSESSVRRHVFVDLKRKYKTVDAAEDAVGLTVEKYVDFREFCKRMDNDLPFYYWTLNERYSEESYLYIYKYTVFKYLLPV